MKDYYSRVTERAVIGGIISRPSRIEEVDLVLGSKHFSCPVCSKIYEELLRVRESFSYVSLVAFILREGLESLFALSPDEFLHDCVICFDSCKSSVGEVGSIVIDEWKRRVVAAACEDVVSSVHESSGDVFKSLCSSLLGAIEIVSTSGESAFKSCAEAVAKALHSIRVVRKNPLHSVIGLPTGITGLDNLLDGLLDGGLYIIGGRTSMGKTSLLLTIALNVSRHLFNESKKSPDKVGYVLFLTLEMSEFEIVCRMFSSFAEMSLGDVRCGNFDSDCEAKFEKYSMLPISFFSASYKSFDDIINYVRIEARKKNVRAVFIDYLQRMVIGIGGATKNDIIGDATSRLKSLAQVLDVPVVIASQLNRRSANEDRAPQLYDLRDSGNIEQDADVVILLHRPSSDDGSMVARDGAEDFEFGNVLNNESMSLMELQVAKNRNGPTGICRCRFMKKYVRFL